ncbi:hypothetical protein ACP4OV_005121 [Aristida adscensionis]
MQKLALLLALLAALAISGGNAAAVRMQLTHADAGRGLTRRELLSRMVLRSKGRAAARFLSGSSAAAPVVTGKAATKGDPTRSTWSASPSARRRSPACRAPPATTRRRLTSTGRAPPRCNADLLPSVDGQAGACLYCESALPYDKLWQQRTRVARHFCSTLSPLPCAAAACRELPLPSCGAGGWGNQTCVYTYWYAMQGGGVRPFGCGLFNHNTGNVTANQTGTGVAGFGRGALSLPSQLKVGNFSYCFTTITESKPSLVLLGLPSKRFYSAARGTVKTTRLIQNAAHPTFYYISLKGITVGSTRLLVPESAFALHKNGTDAFVSQVKLPLSSDDGSICFAAPHDRRKLHVPKLVLHFEGATLDLPRKNYVFEIDDEEDRSNTCIAVIPGGDMTVIGNFQQQNMHVLCDLAGNKLSVWFHVKSI